MTRSHPFAAHSGPYPAMRGAAANQPLGRQVAVQFIHLNLIVPWYGYVAIGLPFNALWIHQALTITLAYGLSIGNLIFMRVYPSHRLWFAAAVFANLFGYFSRNRAAILTDDYPYQLVDAVYYLLEGSPIEALPIWFTRFSEFAPT